MNTQQDPHSPAPTSVPLLSHQPRTLWVLRGVTGKRLVAAIHRVEALHLELRISYPTVDHVMDTLISQGSEAPLVAHAASLRQKLEALGWTSVDP